MSATILSGDEQDPSSRKNIVVGSSRPVGVTTRRKTPAEQAEQHKETKNDLLETVVFSTQVLVPGTLYTPGFYFTVFHEDPPHRRLHLGKTLHETSLLEDQKIMLDLLLEELSRDSYAALIIAGDVYDRTIPPAEAVELFSSFLVRLRSDFPDVTVFIIPGNHDSARRLAFADKILGRQNIHIAADPEESFSDLFLGKDGNMLSFFLLPFLVP